MNCLHRLRNTPWLARLALLWFALTLGAAVASPLVAPQNEVMLCTSLGMVKVVVNDDGSLSTSPADGLRCPLCVVGGAPAPQVSTTFEPPHPLTHVLHTRPVWLAPAHTTAPPPARSPPAS